MSQFANPAGAAAKENAAAYVRDLYAVLGDRDPFAVMEEHAAALETMTRGLADSALRKPEAPGKWSVIDVLEHLADTEVVYGYRVRKTVAEPTPELEGYDQDLWAKSLRYREAGLAESLETIRVLRARNLRLLRSLSDAELDRSGNHSERGPESVRRILHMIAAHDLVHRRQIERILGTSRG